MIILDCESYESTLASLAIIYNTTAEEIEDFINSFDLDGHYEINDPDCKGDQELRNVYERETNLNPLELDKVCWFHLTRALPDEKFNEGILPLSKSLNKVWSVFDVIFKNTEHYEHIKELEKNGVGNSLYKLKTKNSMYAGPYAMLVKEIAFNSDEVGHHDYLRIPEIMEDICNGYKVKYGDVIIDYLYCALTPKIVKFISSKKVNVSCVESALHYAYQSCKSKKMSLNSNTCFDGSNKIIPHSDILNIDIINV